MTEQRPSEPFAENEAHCSHDRVQRVTGVCQACGEVSERYLDWYAKFGESEQNGSSEEAP